MRLTPFVTAAAAALMFSASAHASWDLWDKMKAVGMEDAVSLTTATLVRSPRAKGSLMRSFCARCR